GGAPVLAPFAVEQVARGVELEMPAALERRPLQPEGQAPAGLQVALETDRGIELAAAPDTAGLGHQAQPPQRGVPQAVVTTPSLPRQIERVALRQVLAGKASRTPQPEPACALLVGLLVAEGELARLDGAVERVLDPAPPVRAGDVSAVLPQGHLAEGGGPLSVEAHGACPSVGRAPVIGGRDGRVQPGIG